ncbi:hypothetical protein [uncultured Pseudokineococcus sp.]|uniref:hypothetical protein n=1 Tax=uncultured Pseudokineococcus sp. TaxID=1642928 RepID=UPI002638F0FC|nr:hypothetical protein [uncultured Pseudokineococcus sp.]
MSSQNNTPSRVMHDVGLAAWFGGTLANAVALNNAASKPGDPREAGRVANAGWDRWTPVNAAAIGLHLVGAVGQLLGNRDRLSSQPGVRSMSVAKTIVTAAALGVTAYSRVLGKKVSEHQDVPVRGGTTPSSQTPPDVADAQRQLHALQWVIPSLTGTLVGISSFAGEQQRPPNRATQLVDRTFRR